MNDSELNPYKPPSSGYAEDSELRLPMILLWIAPWKVNTVSDRKGKWNCAVYGFAGVMVQISLLVAVLAGQIDEPFADLAACFWGVITSIPIALPFGFVAGVIFMPLTTSPKPAARQLVLIPWALSGPYAVWIVCFFCRTINHPNFGIVNDDRPVWMTNGVVIWFGSIFTWITILLVAVVWVQFLSGVSQILRNR